MGGGEAGGDGRQDLRHGERQAQKEGPPALPLKSGLSAPNCLVPPPPKCTLAHTNTCAFGRGEGGGGVGKGEGGFGSVGDG